MSSTGVVVAPAVAIAPWVRRRTAVRAGADLTTLINFGRTAKIPTLRKRQNGPRAGAARCQNAVRSGETGMCSPQLTNAGLRVRNSSGHAGRLVPPAAGPGDPGRHGSWASRVP